jgi:hypothetical protein
VSLSAEHSGVQADVPSKGVKITAAEAADTPAAAKLAAGAAQPSEGVTLQDAVLVPPTR